MRIGVIVQARMSSSRLPGKVLRPMQGKPMLKFLFERLERIDLPIAVATSVEADDDPVEEFCKANGVSCVRGPLNNVADRFAITADRLGLDAFVRICGDSPLLDPSLVEKATALFLSASPDLATNVMPRSFPKGQSVEVVDVKVFKSLQREMTTDAHREHVTRLFYETPHRYRIENFTSAGQWQNMQMSVDTAEDFSQIEWLLSGLEHPHEDYGWEELATKLSTMYT